MKKASIVALVLFLLLVTALPVFAAAPSCNWGDLTSSSIAGGFDQGAHSSDPSDDGHGPGTADEPRVGLANVAAQGDLNATCELITSMLP